MKLSYFLNEGLSDVENIWQKKFNEPLPDEIKNKIQQFLPKYQKWIIMKHDSFEEEDWAEYKRTLDKFEELCQKNVIQGQDKDIYKYKNIEAVFDKIKQFEKVKTKTQKEKEAKTKGAKTVFENEHILIKKIDKYDASCQYGYGTQWCVSSKKTDYWWKVHYHKGLEEFYAILLKNPKPGSPLNKVMAQVNTDNTIILWDAEDNPRSMKDPEFKKWVEENEVPIPKERIILPPGF